MYVRAGRPAFARPCVGIHKSTSLMSSSLLSDMQDTAGEAEMYICICECIYMYYLSLHSVQYSLSNQSLPFYSHSLLLHYCTFFAYIYIYIYISVCVYVCVFICVMCIYICICVCVFVCIYVCVKLLRSLHYKSQNKKLA